ncbi:chloride channel protein [Thalassotalea ponticola]|uniref:chloride channel protein n=1 Tax=Thalassotalea ponticola TaxID=1523392 RepID=UPI0025B42C39|nr:chloride channel protein [Thalassotalea ponticola]MDN3653480.1 chloride channel protein [Thalassotalea ponticola]
MSLGSLRKKLAKPEPSLQLCLLAILGATLASVFIILFRYSVESIQLLYLQTADDYTTLPEFYRFITPLIAVCFILLVALISRFKYARMGIPFVLYRLKSAYGVIPFKNTLTQFFGGIAALAGGFSVGREGPAVHIGAAASSFLGNKLSLPYNSIRILCACGIAAGISASFNTPLAAVIFVMEVILREYKLHIFVPVMLASVIGSLMTHAFFGPYHEFEFFAYVAIDFWHYPLLILFGILLGTLAKAFNSSLMAVLKYTRDIHMARRLMIAALLMGLIGLIVPHSMGASLSAITFLFDSDTHVWLILAVLVAKFLATVIVLGLGIPGGIIGPTLGIGAVAGALMALCVSLLFHDASIAGDYALLGMAGMLAATLNAPLAALLTIVELSNQLALVLPAMVVITSAYLTSTQFWQNRSIFLQQLEFQQLPYQLTPVESSLQKYGVLSHIDTRFQLIDNDETKYVKSALSAITEGHLIIRDKTQPHRFRLVDIDLNLHPVDSDNSALKITDMPAIDSQATLSEAYYALYEKRDGAVYIYQKSMDNIIGVLTFEKIRQVLTKGAM